MQTESMTFGGGAVALSQKYSRVQKKGQVTIPVEMRDKLGLKEGDLVAFTETDDGILISRQEVLAMRALDRIGALLKEQGVSLDELMELVREEGYDLLIYPRPTQEPFDRFRDRLQALSKEAACRVFVAFPPAIPREVEEDPVAPADSEPGE